jgi:hypothetical protein
MILLSVSPQPGEKTHTVCPKSPHDERPIAYSFQLLEQEKEKLPTELSRIPVGASDTDNLVPRAMELW